MKRRNIREIQQGRAILHTLDRAAGWFLSMIVRYPVLAWLVSLIIVGACAYKLGTMK